MAKIGDYFSDDEKAALQYANASQDYVLALAKQRRDEAIKQAQTQEAENSKHKELEKNFANYAITAQDQANLMSGRNSADEIAGKYRKNIQDYEEKQIIKQRAEAAANSKQKKIASVIETMGGLPGEAAAGVAKAATFIPHTIAKFLANNTDSKLAKRFYEKSKSARKNLDKAQELYNARTGQDGAAVYKSGEIATEIFTDPLTYWMPWMKAAKFAARGAGYALTGGAEGALHEYGSNEKATPSDIAKMGALGAALGLGGGALIEGAIKGGGKIYDKIKNRGAGANTEPNTAPNGSSDNSKASQKKPPFANSNDGAVANANNGVADGGANDGAPAGANNVAPAGANNSDATINALDEFEKASANDTHSISNYTKAKADEIDKTYAQSYEMANTAIIKASDNALVPYSRNLQISEQVAKQNPNLSPAQQNELANIQIKNQMSEDEVIIAELVNDGVMPHDARLAGFNIIPAMQKSMELGTQSPQIIGQKLIARGVSEDIASVAVVAYSKGDINILKGYLQNKAITNAQNEMRARYKMDMQALKEQEQLAMAQIAKQEQNNATLGYAPSDRLYQPNKADIKQAQKEVTNLQKQHEQNKNGLFGQDNELKAELRDKQERLRDLKAMEKANREPRLTKQEQINNLSLDELNVKARFLAKEIPALEKRRTLIFRKRDLSAQDRDNIELITRQINKLTAEQQRVKNAMDDKLAAMQKAQDEAKNTAKMADDEAAKAHENQANLAEKTAKEPTQKAFDILKIDKNIKDEQAQTLLKEIENKNLKVSLPLRDNEPLGKALQKNELGYYQKSLLDRALNNQFLKRHQGFIQRAGQAQSKAEFEKFLQENKAEVVEYIKDMVTNTLRYLDAWGAGYHFTNKSALQRANEMIANLERGRNFYFYNNAPKKPAPKADYADRLVDGNEAIQGAYKLSGEIKQDLIKSLKEFVASKQNLSENIAGIKARLSQKIADQEKSMPSIIVTGGKDFLEKARFANSQLETLQRELYSLNRFENKIINNPQKTRSDLELAKNYNEYLKGDEYAKNILDEINHARGLLERELNVTPIKEFGTNYAEFYHDGINAIKKLLTEKQGQVAGAFYKDGLGDIDLPWGDFKVANGDIQGYGLSKIAEKHLKDFSSFAGDTAEQKIANGINEIIEKGVLDSKNGVDTIIYKKGDSEFRVGLSKGWNNQGENNWVITAYDNKKALGSSETSYHDTFTAKEPLANQRANSSKAEIKSQGADAGISNSVNDDFISSIAKRAKNNDEKQAINKILDDMPNSKDFDGIDIKKLEKAGFFKELDKLVKKELEHQKNGKIVKDESLDEAIRYKAHVKRVAYNLDTYDLLTIAEMVKRPRYYANSMYRRNPQQQEQILKYLKENEPEIYKEALYNLKYGEADWVTSIDRARLYEAENYINDKDKMVSIFDNLSDKALIANNPKKVKALIEYRQGLENRFNITPIKEFGTNYAEFYHAGGDAVKKLLAEKQGQVAGAFYKDGLGDIDLPWGDFKVANGEIQGYGLSKIAEKHLKDFSSFAGDTAEQKIANGIAEIIEKGKVEPRKGQNGFNIKYNDFIIGVNKGFDKQGNNNWVVTAFDNSKSMAEKKAKTARTDNFTSEVSNLSQNSKANSITAETKSQGIVKTSNNVSMDITKPFSKETKDALNAMVRGNDPVLKDEAQKILKLEKLKNNALNAAKKHGKTSEAYLKAKESFDEFKRWFNKDGSVKAEINLC